MDSSETDHALHADEQPFYMQNNKKLNTIQVIFEIIFYLEAELFCSSPNFT